MQQGCIQIWSRRKHLAADQHRIQTTAPLSQAHWLPGQALAAIAITDVTRPLEGDEEVVRSVLGAVRAVSAHSCIRGAVPFQSAKLKKKRKKKKKLLRLSAFPGAMLSASKRCLCEGLISAVGMQAVMSRSSPVKNVNR